MNPLGTYHELLDDIMRETNKLGTDAEISFGILLADAQQSDAREYIINYLNCFDENSGYYFDFYIPGYVKYGDGVPTIRIERTGTEYYFDKSIFDKFCNWCNKNLRIKYAYNPMLALICVKGGKFGEAKKIVIKLDELDSFGVRKSGELFDKIFEIAKYDNTLEGINDGLKRKYIRGNLLNSIVKATGKSGLEIVKSNFDGLSKYKIIEP